MKMKRLEDSSNCALWDLESLRHLSLRMAVYKTLDRFYFVRIRSFWRSSRGFFSARRACCFILFYPAMYCCSRDLSSHFFKYILDRNFVDMVSNHNFAHIVCFGHFDNDFSSIKIFQMREHLYTLVQLFIDIAM